MNADILLCQPRMAERILLWCEFPFQKVYGPVTLTVGWKLAHAHREPTECGSPEV